MPSGFRLLVYAIVALAVIALAYQIMGPLLSPMPDNLVLIERSLKASETGLGKSFTSETYFKAGEGFSEQTFNKRARNVAFRCINPALCCPQAEECSLSIEWDYGQIKFNEPRTVPVTTRCGMLDSMYACDVYVGEKPAQVEIGRVDVPKGVGLDEKGFDLSKGDKMYFDVFYSNTGNEKMENGEIEVKIFQRYFEDEKWEEKPVEPALTTAELEALLPGASGMKRVEIGLKQNGPFRAEIKVKGLNAGFDEESTMFKATGVASDCEPYKCETPAFKGAECRARCQCQKCLLGSECAELLKKANPFDLQLPPKITLEGGKPDIVGSNIVDMVLGDEMCPSDIVIEEPNALGTLIGFRVKNGGKNPVQKSFKVEAFLGQESKGSVTVTPAEINQTGAVIKSIAVSLPPGSHLVKLVANPGETELEEDYGNNEAGVVVEITGGQASDSPLFLVGNCCGAAMRQGEYSGGGSGAIYLRQALEEGKIKADFKADGFDLKFNIKNMSAQNLKIQIPFGQIFVSRDPTKQNLAKGLGRQLAGKDIFIELPICGYFSGELSGLCLNYRRKLPSGWHDVGSVITDPAILNALESGTGKYAREQVWNAVSNQSTDPKNYGGETLAAREIADIAAGVDLTPAECAAAGIAPLPECTPDQLAEDPSDVDCTIPAGWAGN